MRGRLPVLRQLGGGFLLVVSLLLPACDGYVFRLGRAPFDLVREAMREEPGVTRAERPGPVETALYRAAGERSFLIADTPRPDDDPKLLARRCDGGEAAACGRVAGLLYHPLGARELAVSLWVRACDAGEGLACMRAADALVQNGSPSPDPRRAHALYARGCRAEPPEARACHLAGVRHLRIDGLGWRPDLAFGYLDRACEMGSSSACGRLIERNDANRRAPSRFAFHLAPRLHRYYEALRGACEDSDSGRRERCRENLRRADPARWPAPAELEPEKREALVALRDRVLSDRIRRTFARLDWSREMAEQLLRPPSSSNLLMAARAPWWVDARAKGPFPPGCSECLDACPHEVDESATTGSGAICLCGCLRTAGGCGLKAAALAACLAQSPTESNREVAR